MRNFLIIFLTAMYLVACATPIATSQPTATLVPPTRTPSPTATLVPTNTSAASEVAPEAGPETVDAAPIIIAEHHIETNFKNMPISVNIQTDASVQANGIQELVVSEKVAGKSTYEDAFRAWYKFGPIERKVTDLPTDEDRKIFDDLQVALHGNDPVVAEEAAKQLVTTFYAFSPEPGKEPIPFKVVFYNGNVPLPENVVGINLINIQQVIGYSEVNERGPVHTKDMPRFMFTTDMGSGYEFIIDPATGTLTKKVGINYKTYSGSNINAAKFLYLMSEAISKNNGHPFPVGGIGQAEEDAAAKWAEGGVQLR